MRLFALLAVLGSLAASPAFAQDPVKVGPKVMHDHPALSGVFAADSHFKFTMADGTVLDREGKKGDAIAAPAEKHRPENVGETTAQAILVEFKGPAPKK